MIYSPKLRIVSSVLCAALLCACGGNGAPGALPAANPPNAQAPQNAKDFHFTHAPQKFKVPAGVTHLTITAFGGRGGGTSDKSSGYPGAPGASVKATVPVKPGELLYVYVGGRGIVSKGGGGGGGYNGGGAGGDYGFGGGGSSDVRIGKGGVTDRIVVAAGGGGDGESFQFMNASSSFYYCYGGRGGLGGGKAGQAGDGGQCDGAPGGGSGASEKSGGGGGRGGSEGSGSRGGDTSSDCYGDNGKNGAFYDGGVGSSVCGGSGGGGGGGYYGGGGGGSGGCCNIYGGSASGGGGGGGSSYVEPSAKDVHRTTGGGHPGNGEIIIAW